MPLSRCAPIAVLVLTAVAAVALPAAGQVAPVAQDTGDYLYRFVIIQAAPGKLLDLIELYRSRMPVIAAGGDELPFVVRHSQGDHWDLCVIYPSGSFTEYYGRERVAKRQAAADASGLLQRRVRDAVLLDGGLARRPLCRGTAARGRSASTSAASGWRTSRCCRRSRASAMN